MNPNIVILIVKLLLENTQELDKNPILRELKNLKYHSPSEEQDCVQQIIDLVSNK